MHTRTAHRILRDHVIGILRGAGLDVEPSADDRPGDVAGIPGADLLITVGDRAVAIHKLTTTTADVRAVITRRRATEDPLCILPMSSLVALLKEFSPDSYAGHPLPARPPLPDRMPVGVCIICGVSIAEKKSTALYCSKAHRDRAFHLNRQAARSGALTGAP